MKKLNKATVLLLASVLLLALTLTATFSWFPRAASSTNIYSGMNYSGSAVIKSNNLTPETYKCNMTDGVLDDASKTLVSAGDSVTVPAGGVAYFRTNVKVSGTATSNNFSLVNLQLTGATTNISVCCLSPLKSTVKYTSGGVAVAEHIAVSSATATVDWYLYNSGSSDAAVSITTLPSASYVD